MKTRVLSMIVIATLVFSFGAIAQQNRQQGNWSKMNPERKQMMQKRMAQQKGDRPEFFNEEQKESMKKLHLEAAKLVKPLKNELRELMAKQKTLTTADDASLKAINKNIDKMSEVKAEMAKIQAQKHQEVRAMLSEEQLLRFDAMSERRSKMTRGKAKRPGMQRGEQMRRGA